MPKVLISISDKDLERVDSFCKKERFSRSQFLIKSALDYIEKQLHSSGESPVPDPTIKKPLGRCEYEYCKGMAVGKFHWKYFDNSSGESFEKEQSLCEFHRNMCKSQMEKIEGEFEEI